MFRVIVLLRSLPELWRRRGEVEICFRGSRSVGHKLQSAFEIVRGISWPWVSSRTPSHRIIRGAIWKDRKLPIHERFKRCLQQRGSLSGAVVTFVLFTAVMVVLAFIGGIPADSARRMTNTTDAPTQAISAGATVGPRSPSETELAKATATDAAGLLTFAEILGGTSGILFAVIIFGIQFHAQRLGEAAFLVKGIVARLGLTLLAALYLAVIAANVVTGLVLFRVAPHSAVVMAWLDCPLVVLCFLMLLWLLQQSFESITEDVLGHTVVPALRYAYERHLEETVRQKAGQQVFLRELDKLGFTPDTSEALAQLMLERAIVIRLVRQGQLGDVNLTEIRRLRDHLRTNYPNLRGHLLVELQQETDATIGLVLARPDEAAVMLTFGQKSRLTHLLNRSLVIKSTSAASFVKDYERTIQMTLDGAISASAADLRRWLAILYEIIEGDIRRPKVVKVWSDLNIDCPLLVNPRFQVHDLQANVSRSMDAAKIGDLFDWASALVGLGISYRTADVIDIGGYILLELYRDAIRVPRSLPTVVEWVDSALSSLFARLECRNVRKSSSTTSAWVPEAEVLERVVMWALKFIKFAIERDQINDVDKFFDRFFEYDLHRHFRQSRPTSDGPAASFAWAVSDLHTYGAVLVAGWCVYLAERGICQSQTLIRAFRRVMAEVGDQQALLRVWNRYAMRFPSTGTTDDRLGVRQWEPEGTEHRSGIPFSPVRSDQWHTRGFVALGCVLPGSAREEDEATIDTTTVWNQPRPGTVRQDAERLRANAWIRENLLSDAVGYSNDKLETLIRAIDARFRQAQREKLARALNASLDGPSVARFHSDLEQGIDSRRRWGSLVQAAATSSTDLPPERVFVQTTCYRSEFVAGGSRVVNAVGRIAEEIIAGERQWFVNQLAAHAVRISAASRPEDVRPQVEAAAAAIRRQGGRPFAFVPFELLESVAGPDWPITGNGNEFNGLNQAMLGDIPVFGLQRDMRESRSAIVVDLAGLFIRSATTTAASLIEITIHDLADATRQSLLQQSQSAATAADVPPDYDVRVAIDVALSTGVVVNPVVNASTIELPFLNASADSG